MVWLRDGPLKELKIRGWGVIIRRFKFGVLQTVKDDSKRGVAQFG